jgi:hypothetical protein
MARLPAGLAMTLDPAARFGESFDLVVAKHAAELASKDKRDAMVDIHTALNWRQYGPTCRGALTATTPAGAPLAALTANDLTRRIHDRMPVLLEVYLQCRMLSYL